ncbi:MAG: hypothetical protein AAF547_19400 [Actinomycetota bacterium]
MTATPEPGRRLDRRTFLLAGTAAVVAACSGGDEAAPTTSGPTTSEPATSTAPGSTTTAGPATTAASSTPASTTDSTTTVAEVTTVGFTPADFEALALCVVIPESTAGPFDLEEQFLRRDVTEGRPGHPLRLGLRVVDEDCVPIPGAEVEIWHTDHTGDYSAFEDGGTGKDEAEGSTFCRGFQVADDDGIVAFQTIVPGWYTGRAVHIHVRVRLDGLLTLTGQLYFPDRWIGDLFATGAYTEFGQPDTTLETDTLAEDPVNDGTMLTLGDDRDRSEGDGSVALANLGVRR